MTDVVLVRSAAAAPSVVLVHRWEGVTVVKPPAAPPSVVIASPGQPEVFPDVDPGIAGAGYWVGGVLTRSDG